MNNKSEEVLMLKIDKAILDVDKVICKNIEVFDNSERGLLSQNILAQLRNYIEYIAQKAYSKGVDIDPNDYEIKKTAWQWIGGQSNLRFLYNFHFLLQKSVSHYTLSENGSERLMLKYYEYLLKIRKFLKTQYDLDVLSNLEDYPLNLDKKLTEYHKKIVDKILHPSPFPKYSQYNDRYYIQKIKPFFVNQEIFYEITYTIANDRTSKFDRVIAFTKFEMSDNYAVKLAVRTEHIEIMGKLVPIQIIDRWEVSVRYCELNNFATIFGAHKDINTNTIEYRELMKFLTDTRMSFVDLVTSNESYYFWVKSKATMGSKSTNLFDILDKCRDFILNNYYGSNIIRYLLYKLNNKIIKIQYNNEPCNLLSNLYLSVATKPFDDMPFATSLVKHNPKIYDLLKCIDTTGREHEFLARKVRINEEQNGVLFTPKNELDVYGDVDSLIYLFNTSLYTSKKQQDRKLLEYKNHIYIKNSAESAANIIKK